MADAAPRQETLIAVTFVDQDNANQALARLRDLESQGQAAIEGLAMVIRNQDGQIVENHLTDGNWAGRAGGGLVGLLVGILGGPLGVLLGGSAGLVVGAAVDGHNADEADSVVSDISKSIQVGQTTVVAELVEERPETIDAAMSQLGGSVLRRPLDDVKSEVAVADKAQRQAEKEARTQLRDARHKMHRDEIHVKVEEMKTRLHRPKPAAAVDS
jgi:uncharacterized membrane protein